MKVDKSVCTNDIYDINRAIKFEKVFAILVENKVLAIKRDCEHKKRNKRLRFIGRILVQQKNFLNDTAISGTDIHQPKKSIYTNDDGENKVHSSNLFNLQAFIDTQETIEIESYPENEKETNENMDITIAEISNAKFSAHSKTSATQPSLDELEEKKSTNEAISHKIPCKDINILLKDIHSKDLLEDPNFCEIKSTLSDPICSTNKIDFFYNKSNKYSTSISAQSSPFLSNQRKNIFLESKINCCTELSQPTATTLLISQRQNVSKNSDHNSTVTTNIINSNKNLIKKSIINYTDNNISPTKQIKSQVKQANYSTFIVSSNSIKLKNRINSTEKKSKHLKPIRGLPQHLEYELDDYKDDGISDYGFISSFNQLTTNLRMLSPTKQKKELHNRATTEKLLSASSSKTAASDYFYKENQKIESKTVVVAVDCIDETIGTKKRRASTRRSEPMLTFPSSGQCMLTRPPNQPIQLKYDEDFIFDLSLRLKIGNNNVDSTLSDRKKTKRRNHHNHNHRHKTNRIKKQRMLIHDLDNQKVKVIDPDDLPQRARWTIIATAFLLLIMCLLLVGVTLRMAPIIDDMVRQENERLMQESLNRGNYARNFTETPSYTAYTDGNNII